MSVSEDEQDDNSVFDQLRSIKAFTVDQLYLLHPDVGCPEANQPWASEVQVSNQSTSRDTNHDQNLYQNLVEYEQLRHKLTRLKGQVKQMSRNTFENLENVWVFKEEALRKIGMCQQGKIAETTFRYKKANIDLKKIDALSLSFNELLELISKDYIYYSFESQMKQHKIATQLSIAYQTSDQEERRAKLRSSITTLIDFIKHLGDSKSEFILLCRNWLRCLIKRFLEQESTDCYKFIIAQLCKGPAGTADWSADLIECKPFDQVSEFESTPLYITHCSALLSELFNNLRHRIRRVTISVSENIDTSPTSQAESNDQRWSLIDPRFNCSEELNLSSKEGNTLSESDVLKLCLRIPVAQIFRAFVKKCLETDDFNLETDKSYEYIMLKLLTIGTVIIRTYQTGLETFNSIQYGNLIEYLSSQIRRTVIVLSDQWTEFKRRLKGVDNALLMRLQVEYDNFILRSILIILELRQSGIWRHLSRIEQDYTEVIDDTYSWSAEGLRPAFAKLMQVTGLSTPTTSSSQTVEVEQNPKKSTPILPKSSSNSLTYEFSIEWFKEVSESMLWHILWQFYHNAFVNSCDYHSDNYWLEKFREKSVVYLFLNKIRASSPSECSYLINSITSMLLSRKQDSKLVNFIATEIFNLSFKHEDMKQKVTKNGIRSLIRSADKFSNLISLYISFTNNENIDSDVVELFKGCSLTGWLCDDQEIEIISKWLIEYPLTSCHNKIGRLLISKTLLNSPEFRISVPTQNELLNRRISQSKSKKPLNSNCFVDLKLRRQLALLLYEASVKHLPELNDFGPQSLGTFVEVAFGGLFCEKATTSEINLIELATETCYQHLYVWIWRLLFTFRLHILNQPETDWNDVRCRSGTSRSTKNTVIENDSFHPVPSIQDSECILIADGLRNQNPVASFIYLLMTDVIWQVDKLETCLNHLNIMAGSGHLTPSLMAMKYLTICHLDDLTDDVAKNQLCLNYFRTIITSSFDATRMASLIVTQMQHLKQYRQIQLSQFYITVLLEVASSMTKQLSSSWFSGDEYSLDKIACLLDYIVKFNFPTQRLEIIRKFYDSSYALQGCTTSSSWFGSLLSSNSLSLISTKREFLTTLHVLTQKFKKYTWLTWVTTECDTLRQEKIWEDIVIFLSTNENSNLDMAIKKVCPQINPTVLKSSLPIFSWIRQIFDIVESDLNHPLCPLIWYNFFLNYFANSLNGVSVGKKLVPQETLTKLLSRLDSLFNYHLYKHRNWVSGGNLQQNSLAQLYRAYRFWLQDVSLQDAYVDIDRLRDDYLVSLLKSVMESSTEDACHQYIDIQSIETQNRNLSQVWLTATRLEGNHLIKDMVFVDSNLDESIEILTSADDEVSDAASLLVKPYIKSSAENGKLMTETEFELKQPIQKLNADGGELDLIKRKFRDIFDESSVFKSNIVEFDKIKLEIMDLIQQLYVNKKREVIRMVNCADGTECAGPARIKFDVEEATIDDRKNEFIQDSQRQGEELIDEMLLMPSSRVISATILIEEAIVKLVEDTSRIKPAIEDLLRWINEPNCYAHLDGPYHAANHLLKAVLDALSSSKEVDTYNTVLIEVCFDHPGSVQILSPHFSPSYCSNECFLSLYKKISSKHSKLGSMAMFVLLSKFDVNSWLKNVKIKELYHECILTTCSALKLMGKNPDESYILTYDLYKRHIELELAAPDRRKPEEIKLVLREFLNIMDQQSLCPDLWVNFMTILGLEKHLPSNTMSLQNPQQSTKGNHPGESVSILMQYGSIELDETTMVNVIEDVARLADCQVIFDYHSLNDLMNTLIAFFNEKHKAADVTLLELYKDYLDQLSVVMLSFTFMWLHAYSEQYPDNHQIIWKQFMDFWYNWLFLSKNCQNVGKTSYSLLATQFVAALRFMIYKLPDNIQLVLQSTLSTLANYVQDTKEVVYLELTILQRCLKNLPWSNLIASQQDFENLAVLSEQKNYNISDLVSYIVMQINLKESLNKINENDLTTSAHVSERLATTIVLQSNHLKGFRLSGCYFSMIPVDRIASIAMLILPRMEFANLEHSQNNKLLVNLLRHMCVNLNFDDPKIQTELQMSDIFERNIIYARFVSRYLVDLIKNHPSVLKYHRTYLNAIMDNSLHDIKLLQSSEVSLASKTALYESLLECCSSTAIDENARLFIAKSFMKSALFNDRPIVVMETFHAIGQIISDGRVLVYTIEKMISLYLNMNGHYEKVWKSFHLKVLPSDLYLEACIEENAALALLVYFEALGHSGFQEDSGSQQTSDNLSTFEQPQMNNNKIWSSFFHWISKLSLTSQVNRRNELRSNDARLVIAWLRLLDILEPNLNQFIHYSRTVYTVPSDDQEKAVEASAEVIEPEVDSYEEAAEPQKQVAIVTSHKSLIDFIKYLVSIYDSCNSGGLWSYIKSSRTEHQSRVSIVALAVACFLADRSSISLNSGSQSLAATAAAGNNRGREGENSKQRGLKPMNHLTEVNDEISKLRRTCLSKLEVARRSKHYLDNAQFIEALIESVKRNDKVQYSEGVQLITNFVKSLYSGADAEELTCINKILPSFN